MHSPTFTPQGCVLTVITFPSCTTQLLCLSAFEFFLVGRQRTSGNIPGISWADTSRPGGLPSPPTNRYSNVSLKLLEPLVSNSLLCVFYNSFIEDVHLTPTISMYDLGAIAWSKVIIERKNLEFKMFLISIGPIQVHYFLKLYNC